MDTVTKSVTSIPIGKGESNVGKKGIKGEKR